MTVTIFMAIVAVVCVFQHLEGRKMNKKLEDTRNDILAELMSSNPYGTPLEEDEEYWQLLRPKWADSHPQWYDAQGDNVPEYGREVIVIGRDGKIFYGHRPDPKEVTMVEGKPYHAKTYDKNGWNWPDIALWLDVEIPDELEQITDKWFEENEQRETISRFQERGRKTERD